MSCKSKNNDDDTQNKIKKTKTKKSKPDTGGMKRSFYKNPEVWESINQNEEKIKVWESINQNEEKIKVWERVLMILSPESPLTPLKLINIICFS
jgi:hypothetical protein